MVQTKKEEMDIENKEEVKKVGHREGEGTVERKKD